MLVNCLLRENHDFLKYVLICSYKTIFLYNEQILVLVIVISFGFNPSKVQNHRFFISKVHFILINNIYFKVHFDVIPLTLVNVIWSSQLNFCQLHNKHLLVIEIEAKFKLKEG